MSEHLVNTLDDNTRFSDTHRFYYQDYNSNIYKEMSDKFQNMFGKGSGGELVDTPAKAKAIDSSSMLAYNFFCWIDENNTFTYDGIEYDKVFFEVKLRTLSCRSTPANLDIVLVSKDNKTAWFIESKFTEFYKTGKEELSDSYTNEENHYTKGLSELANLYRENFNAKKHYSAGIKQNVCHLISLINFIKSEETRKAFEKNYKKSCYECFQKVEKVKFSNLLFEPNIDEANELYKDYQKYLEEFKTSIKEIDILKQYIENIVPNDFVITYREIFDSMKKQMKEKAHIDYLKNRYMSLHK